MHTVSIIAVPPYQQSSLVLSAPCLIILSLFLIYLMVCVILAEFYQAAARDFEETTNDEEAPGHGRKS